MWEDLDRLRRLWAARREGKGGVNALAGFSFQLASALVALARAETGARHPAVFIEGLSDLVSAEGGYVIVTQAKLTLESSPLRKALNELWEIDALASSETPDLAPHLHYSVLTSKKVLKDVEAALARWQPNNAVDAVSVETFRTRVSVRVDADPRQTLATHLVNAFGDPDPFGRAESWLGRLLSEPTLEGFEESCRSIMTDLAALEVAARERTHRFHIWDANDCPPSEPQFEADPDKATLVGQTPHRNHLTEGRFARRWFYGTLLEKAEGWLEHDKLRNDGRLPVFWISGRSGTGKSVALLHLLADLQREDEQRVIIWLDQQADRLAEAVRWARPFFAEGREVILASDDPYTPERYQRVGAAIDDALRELDSIAVAYPNAPRPALIFCGPTEQSQFFEDDLTDRVLIEPFPLPAESQHDIDELREWYVRRTGRTDLPVGDAGNILIVQLFFEWTTGQPIKEFAQRFRQRLEGMMRSDASRSIFSVVAEILALNRLYALFPAQSINEEFERNVDLGSAFDRLKDRERHFAFDAEMGGYRVTHPHLANAIYTTWFGREEDRRHRQAHLREGIDAALKYGSTPSHRFAPLWAIARLTSGRVLGDADTAQRLKLIEPELRELLVDLYARQFVASPSPLVDLPVWTDLDRRLGLSLAPSPHDLIASVVREAAVTAPGLRLSCHKLLQHKDQHSEGASIVAELLNKYRTWFEWQPVASDYMAEVGVTDIEPSLRDYVAREWSRSTTRALVGACITHADRSAARNTVLSWLEAAPVSEPAWPGILTAFVDAFNLCETSRKVGWNFLHTLPDHSSWSHVWQRLFAHPIADRQELTAIARRWLASARRDISGWDRIWEELWQASGKTDDDLRARGRKWLDEVPAEHGSWKYLWDELWQASGKTDDDLRARGRKWLDEAPAEHGSWKYLWDELWQASGKTDDDLRARGRKWLDEAPAEHGSWGHGWRTLWRSPNLNAAMRAQLASNAVDWLQSSHLQNPMWPVVWNILWEDSDLETDWLVRIANVLLTEAPPKDPSPVRKRLETQRGQVARVDRWRWKEEWEASWRETASTPAERANLIDQAKAWLGAFDFEQGGWTSVWKPLWEAAEDEIADRAYLIDLAD
jgi:hypothetical protein